MTSHTYPETFETPACFFSRTDGVSTGLYSGLNCGPGSSDDPAAIAENRRIAAAEISGRRDTPLLSLYQIHSDKIVVADSDWGEDRPQADAMVTNRPGLILGILTADCTPVLFADEEVGVIGAAHAGWKGALHGVLENTVSAMERFGANRSSIKAAIGPTIHQPSYEVGTEFRDSFCTLAVSYEKYFEAGKDVHHFQFNLPAFVRDRLSELGLANIWEADIDTYKSENHFSYRRTTHRQEADYGRQISAIMLRDS